MTIPYKTLTAFFFAQSSGNEPVRDWLKGLSIEDKKAIGADIMSVEFGWPIGMPTVKNLKNGIWEVRTNLENRIARVLFSIHGDKMILLNGFIKKSNKTPLNELDIAIKRNKEFGASYDK